MTINMRKILETDSTFDLETKLGIDGIKFLDIENPIFKIYGVKQENGVYRRMPEAVARTVSEGVHSLHANCAGGRVRFKTDSRYIAINAQYVTVHKSPRFPLSGSAGFDMYITDEVDGKETYYDTFLPPLDFDDCYESVLSFKEKKTRQITINFPTFSSVKKLYIGLDEESYIEEAQDYKISTPIVYYGSSITQGCGVCRPGNIYQARISREFDADYVNLGFGGNCKGEQAMADYIKNLDMSVFVYDYDHNTPNVEHLENTHEKFFNIIRKAQPQLPIIMMSAPVFFPDSNWERRKAVIKKTYTNAVNNGDKNVYFIDGKDLMQFAENDGTVDNCHPNDLGFYSMAKVLSNVLGEVLL